MMSAPTSCAALVSALHVVHATRAVVDVREDHHRDVVVEVVDDSIGVDAAKGHCSGSRHLAGDVEIGREVGGFGEHHGSTGVA